tara:strand:- start:24 stop:260 length:237 start_codon:yes stop_codon:yes gene_type:complete
VGYTVLVGFGIETVGSTVLLELVGFGGLTVWVMVGFGGSVKVAGADGKTMVERESDDSRTKVFVGFGWITDKLNVGGG